MLHLVPAVFQPLVLRKKMVFHDLSKQKLTVAEKTFLASECSQKSSLLTWVSTKNNLVRRISDRYCLPYSTIKGWTKLISDGQEIPIKRGRPMSIDESAAAEFVSILKTRRASKDAVSFAETLALLSTGITATKMRAGKRGAAAVSEISVNTQKKFCKMYNVVTVKPQILTDARLKSCLCPRLSYIWGCVLMAYSAGLLAEQKWNADATTIIVSQRGTGSLVCTICDTDDDTPVASSSIPDSLNLLVKWFGLNNAGGESGPLVLIFAVPSMTENTYFATQVLSMSSTSTIGDKGWIYFAKTRGGCYAMWIHYYLHITIPTIELSNSTHLHTVSQSLYRDYITH